VISVHSEISLLFAAGPIPGWTSTVFPPYFVLGAAFSGFAVVSMIAVVLRHAFHLQNLVTDKHLDMLGRLMLACGMMTAYGYFAEIFTALYSGEQQDLETLRDRMSGAYAWSYWGAVVANFAPLQLLWIGRLRRAPAVLFAVGAAVTVGMWLERYMLLVTTLYRDYLVSSFAPYHASFWEWSLFAGSIGLFMTLFLLFVRFLPMISAFEIKEATLEDREPRDA
jgi:molybdopterin-containing oxidoreductase family membrane subunit